MNLSKIFERAIQADEREDVSIAANLYSDATQLEDPLISASQALDAAVIFVMCDDYGFRESYNIERRVFDATEFLSEHYFNLALAKDPLNLDVKFWILYRSYLLGSVDDFEVNARQYVDELHFDAVAYLWSINKADDYKYELSLLYKKVSPNETSRQRYLYSLIANVSERDDQ